MSDVISGIYEIVNIINNKSYIDSSVDLDKRYYEHFNALRRDKHTNKKLQNSFNKYGEEKFLFEILLECDNDDLLSYEDYFIRAFKPELNLQMGARRREGDWKPSLETRLKMSESRKKNSGPNKGKKLPEWHKELMRQINLGNEIRAKEWKLNLVFPNGEIINKTINNLNKFCRENGIKSMGTFTMFLNGKRKSYGNWRIL